MSERLNRTAAVAKQQFEELLKLATLEDIAAGRLGEGARRSRIESLLEKLDRAVIEIQGFLTEKLKADGDSPLVSLPSAHARFIRESLLPNAKLLQTAHLKASGLEILLPLLEDDPEPRSLAIRNALAFMTDYTSIQLADDDDRRIEVDIAESFLEEPWFTPDRWRENMRRLRPALIELDQSAIPPSIRFRLAEVFRTFTFGAWMATIALCRATVEFALIHSAPRLGFSPTRKSKKGERYLMLNDLIGLTIPKAPVLKPHLLAIKNSGNRVLHPERKQNVIPSPRIVQKEALACTEAMIHVIEALYTETAVNAG